MWTRAPSAWTGRTSPIKPEYRRSREIGRLFQDPMRGTAPHMTIEENLALAYLRTAKHQNAFFSRTSKADKAVLPGASWPCWAWGWRTGCSQPVGLLSGGQRQALTLLMATMVPAQAAAAGRAHRGPGPRLRRRRCWASPGRSWRSIISPTMMVTHNMKHALELGNRTLMMDGGRIVLDIGGEEREGLTVDDLLERFRAGAGKDLDNDRILLSE